MTPVVLATGALLPGSVMHLLPVRILAAVVTINTVMYCALAVAKILPRLHPSTWFGSGNRRAQERSIYPAGWRDTGADDAAHPGASADREPAGDPSTTGR